MTEMEDSIQYYREQGAPGDQQMLVYMLREIQQQRGGTLDHEALRAMGEACQVKESMLLALIRRVPGLRLSSAPNRLEICGVCPKGRALRAFIEKTWQVSSGGVCGEAGFSYHVTGCMKNCRKGPSVRFNGTLYPQADEELIRRLIQP